MLTEIFVRINGYNRKVCLEIAFFRQIWINYANNVEFGKHFSSRSLFSIWTISFSSLPTSFHSSFLSLWKMQSVKPISARCIWIKLHTFHIELLNITMCEYCIERLTHAHSRNKYQSVSTIWSHTIQFTSLHRKVVHAVCLWCLFMCDFYLSFKVFCVRVFFRQKSFTSTRWPNERK